VLDTPLISSRPANSGVRQYKNYHSDAEMELILLIGIQGAGKSTFYCERFLHTHVRLSLDLLKTRNREKAILETCLGVGQALVIDNTNVTAAERARYILPAKEAGFRVAGYFFEPDPNGSLARNNQREGRSKVPPAALFGTLKRLQRPALEEGFNELFLVRLTGSGEFSVEACSCPTDENQNKLVTEPTG
jgi:predicted kinase